MAKKTFLGIELVDGTVASFDLSALTGDTLYFVRTNSAKTDGYLYMNNKKYGTGADAKKEIEDFIGMPLYMGDTAHTATSLTQYIDWVVGNKNVAASGDTYVSATASANTVTVAANVATDIEAVTTGDTKLADALAVKEAIDAEKTRALTVESALTSEINAEETRATSAETKLQSEIDDITGKTAVKDVVFDSATTMVQLVLADGSKTTGFDASDFVKDGMLSSVTFDSGSTELVFVWNTDGEHTETRVDISKLIDTYKSGDETKLTVSGYTITPVVDQASGLTTYEFVNDAIDKEETRATSAETILSDRIDELEAGAITSVTVNGVDATIADSAATVTIDSDDIKIGTDIEYSGTTIATSANTVTEAIASVIEQMVENEETTAAGLNDLKSGLTAVSGVAITAVQSVNGNTGTAVTIDGTEVTIGSDIMSGTTVVASGSSAVTTVLEDIYSKLANAVAGSYTGVTSSANTITVTRAADDLGDILDVNLEESSDDTVAAGHIEVTKNDDGALYATMYYTGNDVE